MFQIIGIIMIGVVMISLGVFLAYQTIKASIEAKKDLEE